MCMLKFTHVVDNDTTVHDVHTYTGVFSPRVLIKCRICPYHRTLTRTPWTAQENVSRHTTHSHIIPSWYRGDWWRNVRRYAVRPRSAGIVARFVVVWWTAGGGRSAVVSRSLVDLVCWTTAACRSRRAVKRRRSTCGTSFSGAMSMTMEQVVTQLQKELFPLRAQAAAESGLADAVRAINNLATAHVRKDTLSLIDVKGLGRLKEFTARGEDFQQWSKNTEAFFAGVIKESEMMLEWAAEQTTEITTTAIDLEFLPTDTIEDRGVQNLEFVLQHMHTALMALTSYEANDIVANLRKNPLEAWRRLQKRYDPTTGGRKRNFLRTIISPGRCSLLELHAGIERWESCGSRIACEHSCTVEAKFGFRIRDFKPSDTGARGHSDPMDVDAVNSLSLSSGKGKESSSPRDGCFKCGGAHFQRDCNARKSTSKQSSGEGKQSKSWSKSEGKGKSKENKRKSTGKSKRTEGAKVSHKGKTSKTGLSGFENSKSEAKLGNKGICTDMYHWHFLERWLEFWWM